jgi:hypothetical protein
LSWSASTTVSSTFSGTPVATPDAEPNDLVMSLRTMPDWVRTLGPFEPSPGYGPPVSCGISPTSLEASVVALVDVLLGVLLGVLVVVASSGAQPATAARPAAVSLLGVYCEAVFHRLGVGAGELSVVVPRV